MYHKLYCPFQLHIIWLKICLKQYISGSSRTRVTILRGFVLNNYHSGHIFNMSIVPIFLDFVWWSFLSNKCVMVQIAVVITIFCKCQFFRGNCDAAMKSKLCTELYALVRGKARQVSLRFCVTYFYDVATSLFVLTISALFSVIWQHFLSFVTCIIIIWLYSEYMFLWII